MLPRAFARNLGVTFLIDEVSYFFCVDVMVQKPSRAVPTVMPVLNGSISIPLDLMASSAAANAICINLSISPAFLRGIKSDGLNSLA